jgi:hypothetical protein
MGPATGCVGKAAEFWAAAGAQVPRARAASKALGNAFFMKVVETEERVTEQPGRLFLFRNVLVFIK